MFVLLKFFIVLLTQNHIPESIYTIDDTKLIFHTVKPNIINVKKVYNLCWKMLKKPATTSVRPKTRWYKWTCAPEKQTTPSKKVV
jgi:hypothetical protein